MGRMTGMKVTVNKAKLVDLIKSRKEEILKAEAEERAQAEKENEGRTEKNIAILQEALATLKKGKPVSVRHGYALVIDGQEHHLRGEYTPAAKNVSQYDKDLQMLELIEDDTLNITSTNYFTKYFG